MYFLSEDGDIPSFAMLVYQGGNERKPGDHQLIWQTSQEFAGLILLYIPSGCLGFLPSTGFPIVHPDLVDVVFFSFSDILSRHRFNIPKDTSLIFPIQGGLISHDIRIYTHVVNLKSVD